MDKARICARRSVNIVKIQKCVPKTNLLVYEKSFEECDLGGPAKPYVVPPICALPAKRIRVCTGKDLKRMCPPKLCECPIKKRTGFFGHLAKLLGFGFKSALAGALVYWTYDVGLWGPSDDTVKIYTDFCHVVTPKKCPKSALEDEEDDLLAASQISDLCKAQQRLMCAKRPPKDVCSDPPRLEGMSFFLRTVWNRVVVCVFAGIAYFPDNVIGAYHDYRKYLEENKNAPKRRSKSCPTGTDKDATSIC